jgi:RNA polymerase sigma factor (sigma-70 family)
MSSEGRLEAAQSIIEETVPHRSKPLSLHPLDEADAEAPGSSADEMQTSNGHHHMPGGGTLESSLRESLSQMIKRLSPNPTLRQDLLQEALIHLWRTQIRRPGQTRSWYIQSCRFHLNHYLNSGRSIDSTKRWRDQLPLNENSSEAEENEQVDSGDSVFTCVNAREIMSLLGPRLTDQEQAVLVCLAEGLGPREIGRKLNLSHTMAIRHRRKIASVLKQLELERPESLHISQRNGAFHRNGRLKTGSQSC